MSEPESYPAWLAYEPDLIPPPPLMREEGVAILEEWFRWGEEWSNLLRAHGTLTATSDVLEIGCGLGRIAFAIRYLVRGGTYTGFEIVQRKIAFLERTFHRAHPHFAFKWADVRNSYYNPGGRFLPTQYTFPAGDASQDLVYAASVFTHMVPENAQHYFAEAARVLRPGGRCVFSFFLLERYLAGAERPFNFGSPAFAFDLGLPAWGNDFAYVNADNPEQMTAYSAALITRFAHDAGLELANIVPGLWSGTEPAAAPTQDLVVLTRSA